MNPRRSTRSAQLSSDFQGLLENLHAPSQDFTQNSTAPEHSTLAEASKQDVGKLLDRAGVRGAAAKERSKRVRDGLNPNSGKRGRKNVFLEGEANLFYQRNERHDGGPSENSLVCGAMASTLVDVKYGTSVGKGGIPTVSSELVEVGEDDEATLSKYPDMCVPVELEQIQDSRLKCEDVLEQGSLMEDGFEWELGSASVAGGDQEDDEPWAGGIKIEVNMDTPDTLEKKAGKRRASGKDKEFAELVHKTHLLCLIARGRLVDAACDDPVLQASLLSVVPPQIHFHDTECTSASELGPFVKWFQTTFRICSDKELTSSSSHLSSKEDLTSCLFKALHNQAGSGEEVAALFVSLLRALGFTARYVSVLDVLPLKPDASCLEASADWDASSSGIASGAEDIFSQKHLSRKFALSLGKILAQCTSQSLAAAVTNVTPPQAASSSDLFVEGRRGKRGVMREHSGNGKQKVLEDTDSPSCIQAGKYKKLKAGDNHVRKDFTIQNKEASDDSLDPPSNEASNDSPDTPSNASEMHGMVTMVKRKGDLEFELQLAMAMAATAGSNCKSNISEKEKVSVNVDNKGDDIPLKGTTSSASREKPKIKDGNTTSSTTSGGAVWSRKMGPLLHWAEVYCGGQDGGRWVHVDAGRGLLDGAGMVEGAARSCKVPLRYVVAFAGNGVKDVTRRYVTLWSAVAPLRVHADWWNVTLAPLKELEAAATSGSPLKESVKSSSASMMMNTEQDKETPAQKDIIGTNRTKVIGSLRSSSSQHLQANDRGSLEDMELDIRAYTEPLPKNQQAYKNHHLYVLERWLTKYQALHPRGPILGYCAGQPVFPRTCVQNLHTAEWWLREGLKVRAHETPAKTVKNPRLVNKQGIDDALGAVEGSPNESPNTALFGKWQTEPWHPPPAIGGIVPKNERGNVEVWSEKCLPHGTVHISLPRILPVAKKLEIDFAPAMVGFEIRNRRSVPVFEGIVVCQEYEIALLEAYAEEEYRRTVEVEKKRESQAIARWCQFLRSVTTRQRLQATYQVSHEARTHGLTAEDGAQAQTAPLLESQRANYVYDNDDIKKPISIEHTKHEHMFPEESQSYDERTGIRTKICPCGFVLTVEEM